MLDLLFERRLRYARLEGVHSQTQQKRNALGPRRARPSCSLPAASTRTASNRTPWPRLRQPTAPTPGTRQSPLSVSYRIAYSHNPLRLARARTSHEKHTSRWGRGRPPAFPVRRPARGNMNRFKDHWDYYKNWSYLYKYYFRTCVLTCSTCVGPVHQEDLVEVHWTFGRARDCRDFKTLEAWKVKIKNRISSIIYLI